MEAGLACNRDQRCDGRAGPRIAQEVGARDQRSHEGESCTSPCHSDRRREVRGDLRAIPDADHLVGARDEPAIARARERIAWAGAPRRELGAARGSSSTRSPAIATRMPSSTAHAPPRDIAASTGEARSLLPRGATTLKGVAVLPPLVSIEDHAAWSTDDQRLAGVSGLPNARSTLSRSDAIISRRAPPHGQRRGAAGGAALRHRDPPAGDAPHDRRRA